MKALSFFLVFLFCLAKLSFASDWQYEIKTDELTDKKIDYAYTIAKKGTGLFKKPFVLSVRCKDGAPKELYISWQQFIVVNKEALIDVRFDKEKMESYPANPSTDGTALFFFTNFSKYSESDAVLLIQKIKKTFKNDCKNKRF